MFPVKPSSTNTQSLPNPVIKMTIRVKIYLNVPLSHDVALRSDKAPCDKINKPQAIYPFSNVI